MTEQSPIFKGNINNANRLLDWIRTKRQKDKKDHYTGCALQDELYKINVWFGFSMQGIVNQE